MAMNPPKRPIQPEPGPTLLDTGFGTIVFFLGGLALLIGIGAGVYSLYHFAWPSLKAALDERPKPQAPAPHGLEPVPVMPTPPVVENPTSVMLSPEDQLNVERDKLQGLRPVMDDAARLAEIRRWFGSGEESRPAVDSNENERMAKAIESVFVSTPQSVVFDPHQLDDEQTQSRVQSLMPREAWQQLAQEAWKQPGQDAKEHLAQSFPLNYEINASLPIHVKAIDEQSGGQVRIVYCTLGNGFEVPFRFWLVRREQWKVFDLENLELGLSMCELCAIETTMNAWASSTKRQLMPLLNGYPLANRWDNFSKAAESLPRFLLDYYLLRIYHLGQQLERPQDETLKWLDRIQSPDRMLQPYLIRAQMALGNQDYANVLRFTQLYLDRFPRVVGTPYLIRSDAYVGMNDFSRAAAEIRTYLQISTLTPELRDFLVDRAKDPAWKPHIEPVLKEFGISGYSYPLPAPEDMEQVFANGSLGSYTEFRKGFKTNLLRKAGSPQKQQGDFIKARYPAANARYQSAPYSFISFTQFPENAAPRGTPAVIFLHGGFAYGDEDWDMVLPYLKAGFAVMTPVLRGENYQEGEFSLYYNEVEDVLNATEEFLRDSRIDHSRVFIAGHSAGGTLSLLCAMASKRYRGAVSFSGTMDCRLVERAALLPFDTKDPKEWAARSPAAFAASLQCPTRVYRGDREEFLASTTELMARKGKDAGRDIESQVVPGDHMTAVPRATELSIEFFQSLK